MNKEFLNNFRNQLGADLPVSDPDQDAVSTPVTSAAETTTGMYVTPDDLQRIISATASQVVEAFGGVMSAQSQEGQFITARAILATRPRVARAPERGRRYAGIGMFAAVVVGALLLTQTDKGRELTTSALEAIEQPDDTVLPHTGGPKLSLQNTNTANVADNTDTVSEDCPTSGSTPLLEQSDDIFILPAEADQTIIDWEVVTDTPDGMRYIMQIVMPSPTGFGELTDESMRERINDGSISDEELIKTFVEACAVQSSKPGYFIDLVGQNDHDFIVRHVEMGNE